MFRFFRDMNLARAIIVLSFLGSGVLAYTGWNRQQELNALEESLEYRVQGVVKEIQELALEHTKLSRDKRSDLLLGEESPESYIRKCQDHPEVSVGQMILTPGRRPEKGYVDLTYEIRPQDKNRDYSRSRIARFLFQLENDSRRVKVTDIDFSLADAKVKPHEIPLDAWTFTAQVTSRQKTED